MNLDDNTTVQALCERAIASGKQVYCVTLQDEQKRKLGKIIVVRGDRVVSRLESLIAQAATAEENPS